MSHILTTETHQEGRLVYLLENGRRVGSAWTGPAGEHGFALHMGEMRGPIARGKDDSLNGAVTDLYAAYLKHTGNDAAFPEAA